MRYRKETISHFARNNLMREGEKYRYYFFDYLYYRLFILYRKYNEPARFSACGVLCMISLIALFFSASSLPVYYLTIGFLRGRTLLPPREHLSAGAFLSCALSHSIYDITVKELPPYF